VIHHRKNQIPGRALKEDILPQVRPVAALWEEDGLTPEPHEFGDLLAMVEDEFDRPSDRLQVKVDGKESSSDCVIRVLAASSQINSHQPSDRLRHLIDGRVHDDTFDKAPELQVL